MMRAALLLMVVVACGDNLAASDAVDAAIDAAICRSSTASEIYAATVPFLEYAGTSVGGVYWDGHLTSAAMADLLQLDLYAGYGAFVAGLAPMSVQLAGAELDRTTCGVCVMLFTDLHSNGLEIQVTDRYIPTGGTVTLTSVNGRVQGTLTDVTLTHARYTSSAGYVPVHDGCDATIPSLTIDALIQ